MYESNVKSLYLIYQHFYNIKKTHTTKQTYSALVQHQISTPSTDRTNNAVASFTSTNKSYNWVFPLLSDDVGWIFPIELEIKDAVNIDKFAYVLQHQYNDNKMR